MLNIYEIGKLAIIDDGSGVFEQEKDLVVLSDEGGCVSVDIDAPEVAAELEKYGIGNIQGLSLSGLQRYAQELETLCDVTEDIIEPIPFGDLGHRHHRAVEFEEGFKFGKSASKYGTFLFLRGEVDTSIAVIPSTFGYEF